MSKIKYNISLDMHSSVSQASLAAKQGDDNRQFNITLRSGGQPYKIERGAFAVFSTTLPDGKVIEDNCIIANDEITYDFTQNLTSQVGVLDIEIRLYGPDSRLVTSPTFILVVSPRAAKAEDITSSDSFKALDKLYEDTSALKTEMEEKLENVSNALKGAASGAVVTLTDVSSVEHTLRVTARTNNMLSYPFFDKTKTYNGITFTDNGDGTVTANGTATGHAYFNVQHEITDGVSLEIGKPYSLSGTPNGGSASTYYVTLAAIDNSQYATDMGSGVTFTPKQNKYNLSINVMPGTTVENIVFKPKLEEGTEVTPYIPSIGALKASVLVNDTAYPINTDGTVEVTSLYPTTILTTDTEGVILDVEYNRDINILTKTVPLIDRVTGIPYYLYVSGGKLLIEEREV